MKISVQSFLFKLYHDNLADYLQLRQEYPVGVEIADFTKPDVWSDPGVYQARVDLYKKHILDLEITRTFHGPFWGMDPQSGDPDIRQLSRDKIHRSIDTAQDLGCTRIVFHTGYIPMINIDHQVEHLLSAGCEFWAQTVRSHSIEICLENTWEWDTAFLSGIVHTSDHPRLNICIDTGHIFAFSKISPEEWFHAFNKKITHLHWHDNHLEQDEHLPLGQGSIDWQAIAGLMQEYCPQANIVLELKQARDFLASLEYLRSQSLI